MSHTNDAMRYLQDQKPGRYVTVAEYADHIGVSAAYAGNYLGMAERKFPEVVRVSRGTYTFQPGNGQQQRLVGKLYESVGAIADQPVVRDEDGQLFVLTPIAIT